MKKLTAHGYVEKGQPLCEIKPHTVLTLCREQEQKQSQRTVMQKKVSHYVRQNLTQYSLSAENKNKNDHSVRLCSKRSAIVWVKTHTVLTLCRGVNTPGHVEVGSELNGVGEDGTTMRQAIWPVQTHIFLVGVDLVEVLTNVVTLEHA